MAQGFAVLQFWEVEILLGQLDLLQGISQSMLQHIAEEKMHEFDEVSSADRTDGVFDFHRFIFLLFEVIKHSRELAEKLKAESSFKDLLPFDPDGKKTYWDFIIFGLLLYCCFEVPFSAAFDTYSTPTSSREDVTGIVINAFYMVDIILNFLTAFDRQGYMIRDMREIAKHYVRTWFIPDLLGSFPFELALDSSAAGTIQILRPLKLIRMIRLVKALKFLNQISQMKRREGSEIFTKAIGIFKSIFVMVFMAHLLGCVFIMLLQNSETENWLLHYQPQSQSYGKWEVYVIALYWAIISISTMGYGDITPVTNSERIFVIFVALTGAVVFSYCMGNISSLILQVPSKDDSFRDKLRAVQDYLDFRETSLALKRKVLSYYVESWRKSGDLFDEQLILSELASPLRTQVLREIGERAGQSMGLLEGFDPACVGRLVCAMTRLSLAPGDTLYAHGQPAHDMYLVVRGTVLLHPAPAPPALPPRRARFSGSFDKLGWAEVRAGGSFGELALFPERFGPARLDTAVADTEAELYALSAARFADVAAEFPYVADRLRDFCRLRFLALQHRAPALPAPGAAGGAGGGALCKVSVRIAELKRDLVLVREAQLLAPAAGEDGSQVCTSWDP